MQVISMTLQRKVPLTPDELSEVARECGVNIVALTELASGHFYSVEFFAAHKNEHVATLLHHMADPV